jgi:hypothetical protein
MYVTNDGHYLLCERHCVSQGGCEVGMYIKFKFGTADVLERLATYTMSGRAGFRIVLFCEIYRARLELM